jgi:hypothetical protein
MLRHAVGYPRCYRNGYSAVVGTDNWAEWQLLVGLGLASEGETTNGGENQLFHVTAPGLSLLHWVGKP